MKKITLLFASLLCVAYIAVAQLKLYVYQNDGTRTEFVASTVDSIAFSTITDSPDQPDDPIKPVDPTNGYEYVDLGLPSGTKWATMNVGADSPEDYGDYFAWGETEPKSTYNWETYKWCEGSKETQTKYCTSFSYGTVDNNIVLDLEDDAAYVNWGGSWSMPTDAEQYELRNTKYTTWTWTTQNGVKGYKVTSKTNGNSIFLPAAGFRYNSDLSSAGSLGYYWSSSLLTYDPDYAYYFDFDSDLVGSYDGHYRYLGLSVRPVLRDVEFTFTIMFDGNGGEGTMLAIDGQHDDRVKIPASTFTREGYYFASWNTKADGTGTSYKVGEVITQAEDLTLYAQWKPLSGTSNGYTWIDLGLPSGTKWATMNVGAESPEDYGDYFAWGETEPKSDYDWSTYKWCKGSSDTMTKYCTSSSYGTVDNKTTLDLSDDAAYVNWGSSWRIPTDAEQYELRNTKYTTWTWTTQNGVKGYKVTSKTYGNSIFLPVAGRNDSGLLGAGSEGSYWSSSLRTDFSFYAYELFFYSDYVNSSSSYRYYGQSVRPVLAE